MIGSCAPVIFLPQAHNMLTESDAADFSLLYANYPFNKNLPSSIETKVMKFNIEVNKINKTKLN